ncbi:hypothetical protein DPMN_119630 [Dreissena polymorpha]|uniref:Uncharacterized protein n=1 Tax=Dreissena polymorpha TaxID=45954 RepID=A0A9D4GQA1_DREPO|nr:hypothetical protein DPMN_119630 [Dreissena polymorpha]
MAAPRGQAATTQRMSAALQPEQCAIPEGRLLLEETQGWAYHQGGSHEAESPGPRGRNLS